MTDVLLNIPRHAVSSHAVRRVLMLGTILGLGATSAMGQQEDEGELAGPSIVQQWTLDTNLTYTDNFRRLPTELSLSDVYEGDITNGLTTETRTQQFSIPASIVVPAVGDPVPDNNSIATVDPLDNTVASATLSGAAFFRRPSVSGFISGSIRVGGNLDTGSIDDRLLSTVDRDDPVSPLSLANPFFDGTGANGEPQTFDADYVGSSFNLREVDELFIDPNIAGSATVQVAENLLYVDFSALAQEQALGRNSALVQEGIGQANEEVTYVGGSISPYFFREFAHSGTAELRVRNTSIFVMDEQLDAESASAIGLGDVDQFANDSFNNEALVQYNSGDLFDRLGFSVGAFIRTVREENGVTDNVSFDQGSMSFDTRYQLNRSFSLTSGLGYDDITVDEDGTGTDDTVSDQDLADDLGGLYWNVGFRYAPTRRTSVDLSVGERYAGTAVDLSAVYRPTQRVTFRAAAARRLDTSTQDFAGGTLNLQSMASQAAGRLSESQTSASQDLLNRALRFQGAGYLQLQQGQVGVAAFNSYELSANANFRRTNFSVTGQMTETDREDNATTGYSIGVRGSRQVTKLLSLQANARYNVSESDTLTSTETGTIDESLRTEERFYSLSGAYRLGRALEATAQVYHSVSDSDEAVATGTQLDFQENAVSVGLRWSF